MDIQNSQFKIRKACCCRRKEPDQMAGLFPIDLMLSLCLRAYLLCKFASLLIFTAMATIEATMANTITVTIIFYLSFLKCFTSRPLAHAFLLKTVQSYALSRSLQNKTGKTSPKPPFY